MDRRWFVQVGALVWAGVGAMVALPPAASANVVLIWAASVLGPLAAVAAFRLLARGADRLAGVFLLVSVFTPTYFAWILNVPALIAGAALLASPRSIVGHHPTGA